MYALEVEMKKFNNQLDSFSSSPSKPHALFAMACQTKNEWILDSRASHHMANNMNLFSSLDDCRTRHIFVTNSSPLDVVATGTIDLSNGQINDVFYVSNLSTNLL